MKKKVLIFGENGNVSRALMRIPKGPLAVDYDFIHIGHLRCNFLNSDQLLSTLNTVHPHIIINPAAYTSVDKAEQETDLVFKINVDAVGIIANWCKAHSAKLIHFSSDYVFDGQRQCPWKETDAPHPLNVYGQSKFLSEKATQESGCDHVILRTSWIFSSEGLNFFTNISKLFFERSDLNIVSDQLGAPTYAKSLAMAILSLLPQFDKQGSSLSGVYHISNQGETSWFSFAQEIKKLLSENKLPIKVEKLAPISSEAWGAPAQRPFYSVMNTLKLNDTFGLTLPTWQDDLRDCVEMYVKNFK